MPHLPSSFAAGTAAALLTIACPTLVLASEYDKLTYFTFNGSVQVPGKTLPAGTYQFKLANPDSTRSLILVFSGDGKKVHALFHATRGLHRDRAADDPIVVFRETPAGVPPAMRGWFYPGEMTGQEFVYSKKQERALATAQVQQPPSTTVASTTIGNVQVQPVPADHTIAAETAPTIDTPTATDKPPAPLQPIPSAPLNEQAQSQEAPQSVLAEIPVGTTGQVATPQKANEAKSVAQRPTSANKAKKEPKEVPVGTTGQVTTAKPTDAAPTPGEARTQLPATASPSPLLAVLGITSLLTALGVGFLRQSR